MAVVEGDVQLYSLEQVKIHDGKSDPKVWIVYKDIVYDVTSYLDDHPGGGDLITEYAGKDCTKGFDDFGHSSDAKKMLKQYKIGEIIQEERKGKKKNANVKTSSDTGKSPIKLAPKEKTEIRSCLNIITCGLCG
ncbi:hypothetical protein ABEB36_013860 [Hypothenemus hampei]|uniref:Cytochrome b5 n=1 Tax=Hypothenemus hampei TaxID=57062 RepID=A0ABD1E878_HYPHA